jgi:hypothetical protein
MARRRARPAERIIVSSGSTRRRQIIRRTSAIHNCPSPPTTREEAAVAITAQQDTHGTDIQPPHFSIIPVSPEQATHELHFAGEDLLGQLPVFHPSTNLPRFEVEQHWEPEPPAPLHVLNTYNNLVTLPATCRTQCCISGQGTKFQIHMVPMELERRRVEQYAIVAFFVTMFADGEVAIMSCSRCVGHTEDLMLYRGTTSSRPASEAPKLTRCVHMALTVAHVLTAAGITQKRFVEQELQDKLCGLCPQAAPARVSGLYRTPLPAREEDKYHVVVTSANVLRLFRRHGSTWFCPHCRKYGVSGCGHLRECRNLLGIGGLMPPGTQNVVRPSAQGVPGQPRTADMDFEKRYVVSCHTYDCMYAPSAHLEQEADQ